jgi:leucyl aminopeptidase
MEFVVNGGSLEQQRTGCIVVGVYEGGKLSPSATTLDTASGHALNQALSRGDLEGELGTMLLLTRIPNAACERVLLVGLGAEPEFVESSYHTALCVAEDAALDGRRRGDALPPRACREWPGRRMEDRAGGACRDGWHVSLRQAQE